MPRQRWRAPETHSRCVRHPRSERELSQAIDEPSRPFRQSKSRSRGGVMKREFARRCRELMLVAWSPVIQEQLRLWAEELDPQANPLERQVAAPKGSEPPENVSATPAT